MYGRCPKWAVSFVNAKGYLLCELFEGHEGTHQLEPEIPAEKTGGDPDGL